MHVPARSRTESVKYPAPNTAFKQMGQYLRAPERDGYPISATPVPESGNAEMDVQIEA